MSLQNYEKQEQNDYTPMIEYYSWPHELTYGELIQTLSKIIEEHQCADQGVAIYGDNMTPEEKNVRVFPKSIAVFAFEVSGKVSGITIGYPVDETQ